MRRSCQRVPPSCPFLWERVDLSFLRTLRTLDKRLPNGRRVLTRSYYIEIFLLSRLLTFPFLMPMNSQVSFCFFALMVTFK